MNAGTALQILNALAVLAEHSDKVQELVEWIAGGCSADKKPSIVAVLPSHSAAYEAFQKRTGG